MSADDEQVCDSCAEHEATLCTHCGGDGLCWDGADPLDNCPDTAHACHACNGSGDREDQVIF